MKNEKMLERVHELAATLEKEDRERFDYYRKNPDVLAGPYAYGAPAILAGLIRDLERDINADACRAAGKLDALKAAGRVIKSAAATKKEALQGAWMAGDRQYMCDGYRAFRLVEPLPGLPSIPDGLEPFDVDKCIDPARDFSQRLELPTLAAVKAHIKTETARMKAKGIKKMTGVVWDFGEGLPMVNAQYLVDALEILPGCTCRISSHRPELGGLYLESAAGDGLLMAVNKKAHRSA